MTKNVSCNVNSRNVVLTMLEKTENGEKSHIVLKNTLDGYQNIDKQTRAFITRLFQGTLERQIELDYIINSYSKTKTEKILKAIRVIKVTELMLQVEIKRGE